MLREYYLAKYGTFMVWINKSTIRVSDDSKHIGKDVPSEIYYVALMKVWISMYIHGFLWDVVTHPNPMDE